jgi:hypothetical protein
VNYSEQLESLYLMPVVVVLPKEPRQVEPLVQAIWKQHFATVNAPPRK